MVIKTTVHRFESYWSFDPEHDVKRLNRVLAQWKRVWLITERTLDRNQETRYFLALYASGIAGGH